MLAFSSWLLAFSFSGFGLFGLGNNPAETCLGSPEDPTPQNPLPMAFPGN
jgi:hypothetical protein